MPIDNAELVERATAAFGDGDWDALELLYTPDACAQAPQGWPEAEDLEGREAVIRQFQRLKDVWEEDRLVDISSESLDDERVLVHGTWHTRGKGSGIENDLEFWIHAFVREGRIHRVEFYLEGEQAKRAAGTK